jgi:tripartite-type tricarboxylate transporter receptor subunit TctC
MLSRVISRRSLLMCASALTLCMGLAVSAVPTLAAPPPGELVNGKFPPLPDGYPNKPIQIIVVDEPGSADSIYANQLIQAAQPFSPVPLKIEHRIDFSTFGTWEALAWLVHQGKAADDGYITFVYTAPDQMIDLLAVDIKKAVGVDFSDLRTVIATEEIPLVMFQRKNAPWGHTVQDLVKYAKEHPGQIRHVTGGVGSGGDAVVQAWSRELGIKVKDIIGGSTPERALAVAAGEADLTAVPLDTMLPHYQAGRVDVLVVAGQQKLSGIWADKTVAGDLGLKYDPVQRRGFAITPKVPDARRDWLFKLLEYASQQEGFVKNRQQIPALRNVVLDDTQVRKISQAIYDQMLPIYKEMGNYWGDKK